MTQSIGVDPQSAFARYLQVADRLPRTAAGGLAETGMFTDIAARFDLILFDAYGVLNVGETAIPGATDTIAALLALLAIVAGALLTNIALAGAPRAALQPAE